MITKETLNTAVADLCYSIDAVDNTINTKADGTNWTVADSLSNIHFQLERIADALESQNKITEETA